MKHQPIPLPHEKPFPWFKFLLFAGTLIFAALYSFAAQSQMCGDCNKDGEVTISEIISVVNNFLIPCDCRNCPPDDCVEVIINDNGIHHLASMCLNDILRCGGE